MSKTGLVLGAILIALAGCNSPGRSTGVPGAGGSGGGTTGGDSDGGSSATGGSAAAVTGGSFATGGSAAGAGAGGNSATGGFGGVITGGTGVAGGSTDMGGAGAGGSGTGGSAFDGSVDAAGGTGGFSDGGSDVARDGAREARATGGSATGGTSRTGGSATGGTTRTGGSATGGTTSTGGSATGGTSGSGGIATGGTSSGTGGAPDRCDVGVYNAASPPQVLSLSGDLGTHDPSAIQSGSTYYLFATGIAAKMSTNLTSWSNASAPFGTPSWLPVLVPGVTNLWAADISYFGGQYHLFYCGSTFGSNRSCIGQATRLALNSGSWTDQGSPVICSNTGSASDNWNALDPAPIVDTAGAPWLVFGSWWSGIKITRLDPSGARSTTDTTIYSIASHASGIEGAYMVRRCGYYYLFVSWDVCCQGVDSTYKIAVGRSTSINSGFVDKTGAAMTSGGGFLIAQGNGTTFAGPGGQSVMIVGSKAYLVYHAYAIPGGASQLRIADLVWDGSGWPVPVGP